MDGLFTSQQERQAASAEREAKERQNAESSRQKADEANKDKKA